MSYVVINLETGNGMYDGTKEPTEYADQDLAQANADKRNAQAVSLGIETRYAVVDAAEVSTD